MKHKAIITIITFAGMVVLASCNDGDKIITIDQLPEAAKTYVEQNYSDQKVLFVKKDAELFNTKYKVQLEGGMELEFNKNGEVIDIDIDANGKLVAD